MLGGLRRAAGAPVDADNVVLIVPGACGESIGGNADKEQLRAGHCAQDTPPTHHHHNKQHHPTPPPHTHVAEVCGALGRQCAAAGIKHALPRRVGCQLHARRERRAARDVQTQRDFRHGGGRVWVLQTRASSHLFPSPTSPAPQHCHGQSARARMHTHPRRPGWRRGPGLRQQRFHIEVPSLSPLSNHTLL